MKTKLILKSLAELPANALSLATALPGRAVSATRHALTPPVRAMRRQVREARRRSQSIARDLQARATTPLHGFQP